MSSQVAKMTSSQSGLWPNPSLLHAAKVINLGLPLYALIHGVATIETIDLALWERIAGCCCGISA
jgi:hypothetical protein